MAYTSLLLVNPKSRSTRAHGGREAVAAKDYVSMMSAMMKAFQKQSEGGLLFPEQRILTSCLTCFSLPKQAIGFSNRPVFRCAEVVEKVLTWAYFQEEPLDVWNWEFPWHLMPQDQGGEGHP
jgi:hypothetical protein